MPDQLFSVSKSLIQYKHKEQILSTGFGGEN